MFVWPLVFYASMAPKCLHVALQEECIFLLWALGYFNPLLVSSLVKTQRAPEIVAVGQLGLVVRGSRHSVLC